MAQNPNAPRNAASPIEDDSEALQQAAARRNAEGPLPSADAVQSSQLSVQRGHAAQEALERDHAIDSDALADEPIDPRPTDAGT